eukprot:665786-Amphidinium_carterae.1
MVPMVRYSKSLDGTDYIPGCIGLNNIKNSDYQNVIIQCFCQVLSPKPSNANNWRGLALVDVQRYHGKAHPRAKMRVFVFESTPDVVPLRNFLLGYEVHAAAFVLGDSVTRSRTLLHFPACYSKFCDQTYN